jgi:hypothetical protein
VLRLHEMRWQGSDRFIGNDGRFKRKAAARRALPDTLGQPIGATCPNDCP